MYKQHPLSLAFLTVQGCPPLESIQTAADAGYDAAGLRLAPPVGLSLAHPIVGNKALIRDLKNAAGDLGVRLFDGELLTLLPENDLDRWRGVIDTAAELGIPMMQVHGEDPAFARASEALGLLADMAADANIRLAIEFMRWRVTATIEDAAKLALASGRGNVGILLDALHLSRSGGSPAAVAALPINLMLYLQICDAPADQPVNNAACIAEARGGRMLPSEGGLWLKELMSVLPKNITISVETPHKGDSLLSFAERAEKGMTAARRFLDTLES
jgi:sugar phosphate isomerase/epimerase